VVAVCDVYGPHVERAFNAGQNDNAKRYRDYHDLLDDPNVEAVVIATPDHWHEQMVIDAAEAGKAIYCEKGLATSIKAAKRMRAAVKKNNTVFQLGHQGRQYPATAAAGDLIREGAIGPVTLIHTYRYLSAPPGENVWRWYGYYDWYDRPDPKEVIKELDWERWLGKTPKIEFNDRHFWNWRCYWPYGTGQAGDMVSHELDHVQCVLGWGIPDTCMCSGFNALLRDDRDVPDTWLANYQFEEKNCSLTFEGCMNTEQRRATEYIGTDGQIVFAGIGQDADRFTLYKDDRESGRATQEVKEFTQSQLPKWPNHMEDFLTCVRTGERPKCNIDQAFIGAVTFLMSVESYHKQRQVRWDPDKEQIVSA
jgi:predicted dehydrogenase